MPPILIRELTDIDRLCLTCPVPNGCNENDDGCARNRKIAIADRVKHYLEQNGAATYRQLLDALHLKPSSLSKTLKQMWDRGQLDRTPTQVTPSHARYLTARPYYLYMVSERLKGEERL